VQALLLFVAVASDAAASFGAVFPRMAAMVAVGNEGGLMEPQTTIELRTCKWLGIIALACSAAAELVSIARSNDPFLHWTNREPARRSISRGSVRRR
jgi:hypothetical protein